MDRGKKRFVQLIGMSPVDPTEHQLQLDGLPGARHANRHVGVRVLQCLL